MKELATEIRINSRPEIVWKILTDFKNYSQWNPIIIKIIGELSIGNKLEIHVNTIGERIEFIIQKLQKLLLIMNYDGRENSFLQRYLQVKEFFQLKNYLIIKSILSIKKYFQE